jgi:hypothetical protein
MVEYNLVDDLKEHYKTEKIKRSKRSMVGLL